MTVVGCSKLTNKEWLSRQDPYVVIEYSAQKFTTRTCTDGGRNPSFNESYEFQLIDSVGELNVSVWNENMILSDDYIGSTKIPLKRVIESGYDDTQWSLTNNRSGKSSGVLNLVLRFARTNRAQEAPAPAGYPSPPYGQPTPPHSHYPPQHWQQPYPAPFGPPPPDMSHAPVAAPYPPQSAYVGTQACHYTPASAHPLYPPAPVMHPAAAYHQYRY